MLGEAPPYFRHLDGLVQESMLDAERGGLQGEPLVSASGRDPVRLVVLPETKTARPGELAI